MNGQAAPELETEQSRKEKKNFDARLTFHEFEKHPSNACKMPVECKKYGFVVSDGKPKASLNDPDTRSGSHPT